MRKTVAIAASAFLLAFSAFGQEPAPANQENASSEIERLRKIVMEEQQIIADCMKRIDKLEQGKATADKNGLGAFKIGGDLRYRYETIKQDPETVFPGYRIPNLVPVKDAETRERQRLRLRINMSWKINDDLSIVTQFATSENNDPISTNQTLGGGFSKKNIYLDMLYADYHPLSVPGLNVYAGKMKNPFFTPGKTQLIWDSDLTPEGLAASYTRRVQDAWDLSLTGGYFQIQENARDYDSQLAALQGSVKRLFNEEGTVSALVGLSFYDYINTKGYRTFFTNTNNFGNSLNLAYLGATAAEPLGFYAQDYRLVELFSEVTFPVGKLPLTLYGDYVINTASHDDTFSSGSEDTAWAVGMALGKCVAPKSWALRYEYRDVQRDAVVGAFSDSDFGGGGTSARGHVFGSEYMVAANVKLALTYFLNDDVSSEWLRMVPVWGSSEKPDTTYQRLQMDFNVKF